MMAWSSYGQGFNSTAQSVANGKTKICDISSDIAQVIVVAIVIGKQDPRLVQNKRQPGSERYALNFTLRDSPRDTLNAVCWGDGPTIRILSKSFTIGNIIKVKNAQIVSRLDDGSEERYRPHVSCSFQLNISPIYSELSICEDQYQDLYCFLRCPLYTPSCFLTLADVIYNGQNIDGVYVNLLVIVREIGTPCEIITKDGKTIKKLQLNVFDQSYPVFPVLIWDEETSNFLMKHCEKRKLLFIADIKVNYNNFLKGMIATAMSCTIFTPDPEMQECVALHEYAQTVSLPNENVSDDIKTSDIRLPVYTIQQICKLMYSREISAFEDFEGMTFAFISGLDIDGNSKVTSVKCSLCKYVIHDPERQCQNSNCAVGSRTTVADPEQYFDVLISLSDHTGSLTKCSFSGVNAEKLFGVKVKDFLEMSDREKTKLKWKYLWERFKIIFKIPQISPDMARNRTPYIVSCDKMNDEDMKLFNNLTRC